MGEYHERTPEEAWNEKKAQHDVDPAAAFVSGWCHPFAVAFHHRNPELRIRWVPAPSPHAHCTDGTSAYDSAHLLGISLEKILEKYCGFPTRGEGVAIDGDGLKQQFAKNFPTSKWDETVDLAEAWLDSLTF